MKPASAKVGTCGSSGARLSPVMAIARALPERTCGTLRVIEIKEDCTWPLIRSANWVAPLL